MSTGSGLASILQRRGPGCPLFFMYTSDMAETAGAPERQWSSLPDSCPFKNALCFKGWDWSSVVGCLPGTHKVLGSIPSITTTRGLFLLMGRYLCALQSRGSDKGKRKYPAGTM